MFKRLFKSKVFWASIGGIFIAIGAMVSGGQSVTAGLMEIVSLLLAIFFRDTAAKMSK